MDLAKFIQPGKKVIKFYFQTSVTHFEKIPKSVGRSILNLSLTHMSEEITQIITINIDETMLVVR